MVISPNKKRLNPLTILEDISFTYWKRGEIRVTVWICDYSNSPRFKVSCLTQFSSQVVNVTGVRPFESIPGNTYCRGGRKLMFEFYKRDVEVKDPSRCCITVSMKPSGIWVISKKSKEMATVVN